ncbi:MAG: hypothetical protein ACYS9Y_02025 [Planctomycetota bacterium]|jgi:hypothetical protein
MSIRKVPVLFQRFFEYKYLPVILAVIAFVIMIPALKSGFTLDEYYETAILTDPNKLPQQLLEMDFLPENSGKLSTAIFDMINIGRQEGHIQKSINNGMLPWWTYQESVGAFFRPVHVIFRWLDCRLFADSQFLMHAHSLLWFAAVIFVVTILYRRLMTPCWLAGFAALLFLLNKSNYFPAMCIANRSTLLMLFFGVNSLIFYHRWRTSDSKTAITVCYLSLVLSLLAKESGICVFISRRVVNLIPAVLIIVAWRIIYNSLGYGFYGGDMYADPIRSPFGFLQSVIEKGPVIFADIWGLSLTDISIFFSQAVRIKIIWITTGFYVFVLIMILPLLRKNQLARFWFLAMAGSLVVSCSAMFSRTLLFASIGGFGLITLFINDVINKAKWLLKTKIWLIPAKIFCLFLLLAHIPLNIAARFTSPAMYNIVVNSMDTAMVVDWRPEFQDKDIILVNCPMVLACMMSPYYGSYHKQPFPESMYMLSIGIEGVEVTRVDEKRLLLKAPSGSLIRFEREDDLHLAHIFNVINGIVRGRQFPMQPGQSVITGKFTAEVVAVDDRKMPKEVLFTFNEVLEESQLYFLWFNWLDGKYHKFQIPQIGQSAPISAVPQISLADALRFIF